MMRTISPSDNDAIVRLSVSSGLFTTEEATGIHEMLNEYHSMNRQNGHRILIREEHGTPVGLVYFCPRTFADRVWELLMIAVDRAHHRTGIGSQMLQAVEADLKANNGRLLLIETSDTASFRRTRQFYLKHDYTEVARIPDYFADGDGKVSFIKRL